MTRDERLLFIGTSLTDKYSLLKDEHATTKRAFDTAKHENSRLVHKWEDAGTKLQELETELEEMRKANETRALTAEAARDEALAQVEQLEQKIERIKASHSYELQRAIDQVCIDVEKFLPCGVERGFKAEERRWYCVHLESSYQQFKAMLGFVYLAIHPC
eukprot:m.257566 g.257566  ORF g.257566 m.257566 type:complete len:160 (+) comp15530_c1_seq4:2221-2700(+)